MDVVPLSPEYNEKRKADLRNRVADECGTKKAVRASDEEIGYLCSELACAHPTRDENTIEGGENGLRPIEKHGQEHGKNDEGDEFQGLCRTNGDAAAAVVGQ